MANLRRGFRRIYYLSQTCWIAFWLGYVLIYVPWNLGNEETFAAWNEMGRQRDSCLGSAKSIYPNATEILKPTASSTARLRLYELEIAKCYEAGNKTSEQFRARSFIKGQYAKMFREFFTPTGWLSFWREVGASGALLLLAFLLAPLLLCACLAGIVMGAQRAVGWVARGFKADPN
jgi:hypothetical protein